MQWVDHENYLIRASNESLTWTDRLCWSPGSRSSQSARGSGNSWNLLLEWVNSVITRFTCYKTHMFYWVPNASLTHQRLRRETTSGSLLFEVLKILPWVWRPVMTAGLCRQRRAMWGRGWCLQMKWFDLYWPKNATSRRSISGDLEEQ